MEGVEGHADGAHRKAHQHEAQPGAARKHEHSSPPWQTRLLSCDSAEQNMYMTRATLRSLCRMRDCRANSAADLPCGHRCAAQRALCGLPGHGLDWQRTPRSRPAAHRPPCWTLCDLENAGSGAAPLSGTPLPSIRTTDTDSGRWTDLSRAEPSAGRAAVSCSLSPARERQKSVPRP